MDPCPFVLTGPRHTPVARNSGFDSDKVGGRKMVRRPRHLIHNNFSPRAHPHRQGQHRRGGLCFARLECQERRHEGKSPFGNVIGISNVKTVAAIPDGHQGLFRKKRRRSEPLCARLPMKVSPAAAASLRTIPFSASPGGTSTSFKRSGQDPDKISKTDAQQGPFQIRLL